MARNFTDTTSSGLVSSGSDLPRVAVYARYSTDMQRATSIEDQVRRCKEVARSKGLTVRDDLQFSDAALSGQAKDTDKRVEYLKMLGMLKAGQIDVLVVDEVSRITRDGVEHQLFLQLFEKNRRLRLITADGVDTNDASWQLQAELKGLIAQHAVRETRHRVKRGMVGVLERGFMYGYPPLGYSLKQENNEAGTRIESNRESRRLFG